MKAFLCLIGTTLFLGTALSLGFRNETVFYFPIYLLALYHIHRINYSKGFFLIYLTEPEKKDAVKVRVGPTEIEAKDDAERNEDRFLDLFDWKKAYARRSLSWVLFAASIYILFFRLKVEVTLETVLPLLTCLCLMRVIAVGHFLVPLSLSLYGTLKDITHYKGLEFGVLLVYGILFVINLALIYPSEERLGHKLRDWLKGKWLEIAGTLAILLVTFAAAWFLLKDFQWKKKDPEITPQEIQKETKKVERIQSSMQNMLNKGLTKNNKLLNQAAKLSEKMKENPSPKEWKEIKDKSEKLDQDFKHNLAWGPCPDLTPELLDEMKRDLTSRGPKEISPEMEKRIQNFLKKAENFKGSGGDELISEYREMKFGNGGYYRPETEFDHSPVTPGQVSALEDIKKAEAKKKEISEKLAKNIDELKGNQDEGLQSVNKALKDELEKVDSLAGDERAVMQKELAKSQEIQKNLDAKTTDPRIKEKLDNLAEENRHLNNELTPHMKAEEKSKMAQKILGHQKKVESAGREVREQIATELQRKESEKAPEEEKDYSKILAKILRFWAIGAVGLLILWFMNRMSKKGVKKVRGIPEEVKEELSKELRLITKKNLSPREEVIETYNVFHDGLRTLVFTNETPPSCIVYEGIKSAEPELERPTFTVTETFAKTLYGERDVSLPELRSFRKDVRKIFSFFDITY